MENGAQPRIRGTRRNERWAITSSRSRVAELDAQAIKVLPREIVLSAVPFGSRGATWKIA
jgi:hypothetical protein